MKIYEGTVNLIGAGVWSRGRTTLSVLEIGDHSLRSITLPDYLSNYLNVGDHVRILIDKGLLGSYLVAVEVNGKKYKISFGFAIVVAFAKCFFFSLFVIGFLVIYIRLEFAVFISLAFLAYQLIKVYKLTNF